MTDFLVTRRPADTAPVELSADDDAELARILENYLAAVEAGQAPSDAELLTAHPRLASRLEGCLRSLHLLDRAGSEVRADANSERAMDSPAGDELVPERRATLGDFRLERELGRGGMGIVYEAEQLSLGRRVAVKVLPFAAMLDERHLARFKNEARAAASLHHPHIVPVFYVGAERGVHFYAMQYIEGYSLAQLISNANLRACGGRRSDDRTETDVSADAALGLPPSAPVVAPETIDDACTATLADPANGARFRSVAELGIQAAAALHYAHESGVVHRDVKPSNLLIEGRNLDRLTDVSPHLWVADFGLARISADPTMTLTGDLVGTLRYMSPEQLRGRTALVDHRTDVYSLGVTLYELLTGRPAFDAENSEQLLRQVLETDPPSPRTLDRAIPLDMETIVLKAMRKDAGDRYATAQEFADDLRRFAEHKPIQARPMTRWEQLRKILQRHSNLVWSLTAIFFFAAVGLAVSTWLISKERRLVVAQLAETELARRQADENFNSALAFLSVLNERIYTTSLDGEHVRRTAKLLTDSFLEPYVKPSGDNPATRMYAATANQHLAKLSLSNGDLEQARDYYLRAAAIFSDLTRDFPDDPNYFSARATLEANIGCHLFANGDRGGSHKHFEIAAESYRRMRALAPDGSNFPFWYTSLSATRGMVGLPPLLDARALLPQYGNGPESPRYWHITGPIHYRQGRWQAAADAMEKSIVLTQQKYPYQYVSDDRLYLAMAYWKLGRIDDARTQLALAIEQDRDMRVWREDNALLHAEAAALVTPSGDEPVAANQRTD